MGVRFFPPQTMQILFSVPGQSARSGSFGANGTVGRADVGLFHARSARDSLR